MSYTVEKIASNKVKLSFVESAESFDAAVEKAYLKDRSKINVPGFRKGKAPRKLIENMYGEGVFYDDAFELVAQPAYEEAIKAENLQVVDRPQVDVQQIGAGQELKYTLEVFVKPDVTLGEYKGVAVEKNVEKVTDEAVDARIQNDVERASTTQDVTDRAVENGDIVNLDYAGSVYGVAFEGGKGEEFPLTLGSNQFIPGFEEQLLGKNPGDDVTVHVTFPAQYHAPELAGKDAEFRCHIHEIRTTAPYALDDVFAKEVGQCENMAEMRENMRKSLENYYAERAELELRDRLLRQAADTMDDFTPNPAEISKAVEEQLDTMSAQLAQNNLTLDDYCKFSNSTLEQLREDARPGAEEAVRIKALVRRVAQAEDLHAHEEDVAQALSEICRANHMTMEELQPYYDDTFAAAVEYSILLAKVTKRIRESAILEQ